MASLFRTFCLARLRPAVTLAALLLQACASDEAPLPCPDVVRIVDASRMVGFEGFGRDLTDVRFEADLEYLNFRELPGGTRFGWQRNLNRVGIDTERPRTVPAKCARVQSIHMTSLALWAGRL